MQRIKSFRLFLLATLTFSFIACSKSGRHQDGATNPENVIEASDEGDEVAASDTLSDTTQASGEVTVTADWANAENLVMNCNGSMDLAKPVGVIATNITHDSLMYNVEPFSDCSGTFHRFLDSLKKRCSDYAYPDKNTYRDSRDLGKWYYENEKFVRVTNALEMGHYIKPGAVMFYGPRKAIIDSLGVESLFAPGGINHVGVIVSVQKDDQGIVTGYSLFHGQRPGKMASTTNYHKREYRNRPEYPPYGNGSEQWVGVAPIISE